MTDEMWQQKVVREKGLCGALAEDVDSDMRREMICILSAGHPPNEGHHRRVGHTKLIEALREQYEAATLARAFHEAYERLAPSYGYETRRDSAVPWADVPDPNKALMQATAMEVARPIFDGVDALEATLSELEGRLESVEGPGQMYDQVRQVAAELGHMNTGLSRDFESRLIDALTVFDRADPVLRTALQGGEG